MFLWKVLTCWVRGGGIFMSRGCRAPYRLPGDAAAALHVHP